MKKQSEEETQKWEFINLNREVNSTALLKFLEKNHGFKVENNQFLDSMSFSFGKNLKNNPSLLHYIATLGLKPMKVLEGLLYRAHCVPSIDYGASTSSAGFAVNTSVESEQASRELNVAQFFELKKKEEEKINPLSVQEFQYVLTSLLNTIVFTHEEIEKFLVLYLKLDSSYQSAQTVLEYTQKMNNTQSLERVVETMLRGGKIEFLMNFLNQARIDINLQYPRFNNTVVHHYCFYKSTLDDTFLTYCREQQFNPNLKNNFGQSPLYMLIENAKFEEALKFLKMFSASLEINEKFKGKTYLHILIISLNKMRFSSEKSNVAVELFSEFIKLNPKINIRSGEKSKGKDIVSYIENKIIDKALSEALKNKLLLELGLQSEMAKPNRGRANKI